MSVVSLPAEADPPEYIYKYRSFEKGEARSRALEIINFNRIYFANIRQFNDPFDCLPKIKLSKTYAQIEDIVRDRYPDKSRHERRQIVSALRCRSSRLGEGVVDLADGDSGYPDSRVGVLCLAKNPDNFLMWSHYADSHRGLCFRFKAHKGIFSHARAVVYSKERPLIGSITHSPDEAVSAALLTKADFWAYEEEWRVLSHPGAPEGLPAGPGTTIFPHTLLDGVIMGANISNSDREEVIKIITERNEILGHKCIEILISKLDDRLYKLNIENYA